MRALDAALDYAARGWSVFPCGIRAKEPACPRGFKAALTNPATIRRWWNIQPYNVGVATGLASGVWVLDIDGGVGAAALGDLEARHGVLPETLCSVTGGGCHLWFRADSPIPTSTARIHAGIDVRADGGYVVAPPSVHPDGAVYRWVNDREPVVAPDWLVQLARQRPGAPAIRLPLVPRSHAGSSGAYGKAALNREIEQLAKTGPGARNHALNRASFSLHQLVAGGELDGGEVRDRLLDAAAANGLMSDPADGARRVMATIRSGANAGLAQPRSRRGGGA